MKLVVQRVSQAKVIVKETGKISGEIGRGYMVLFGAKKGDTPQSAEKLAEKISKLRIMSDEDGKMNLNLSDAKGEIIVVSQFTLYADTSAGNRPSFVTAENPDKAKELYLLFINKLKEYGLKVKTGSFGDYMDIEMKLDGPVTISYE